MTTVLALLLALLAGIGVSAAPALAQVGETGSFLDPFPESNRYRTQVWGDQMAEGLLEGLSEQLAEDPRLQLDKKQRWLNGLLKTDVDQDAKALDQELATNPPHIVVLMLGAGDRLSLRRPNGRRVAVGSDEWKTEYARRLDVLMRTLRKRSIAVFWIGLPIMRRQDVTEDVETINELFRNRALANGVRFVDIFASFADAEGAYSSHGPDLAGKPRLLRDPDGVHFTGAGYRKLAYFVERELKRAAAQAWDERMIPLAGNEAEQARVRPPATVKLAPFAMPGAPGKGGTAGAQLQKHAASNAGDGVKADTSRITLRSKGEHGREESVTLEILRPAIPASVVALLTRRETADKPTHVGDSVMTEILGGLTVVSSVTPLGDAGERRRAGSDQTTPLHRVLQRGESLPPKPGRADEMPWPRPEPVLDPRLSVLPAPEPATTPIDTGSVPGSAPAPSASNPPLPRRPSAAFDAGRR
ncbi:MAG: DUF459 domain-containing protein [Hyphomicrobiales bacterium]|nr:DUF459 domain-containing protein [Hyphomicrobiales bacterium]